MKFNIVLGNHPPAVINTTRDHTLLIASGLREAGHWAQLSLDQLSRDGINLFFDFFDESSPAYFENLRREGYRYALITTEIVKDDTFNFQAMDGIQNRLQALRDVAAHAEFVWVMHEPSLLAYKDLCCHNRCYYLPLGFSPGAREIKWLPYEDRDIDFLFFGYLSDYRRHLIERLREHGCHVEHVYNVPGFVRNSLIERTRINLSLRQTIDWNQPSVGRISYLVTNQRALICDKTENGLPYESYAITCPSEKLVQTCIEQLESGSYQKLAAQHAANFAHDLPLEALYRDLVAKSQEPASPGRIKITNDRFSERSTPSDAVVAAPAIRGRQLRSIALFAPNSSALHVNVLLGLRKEFVRRGVDAHVAWGLLSEPDLAHFCNVYRPDAVLEIDRTRSRAAGLPKSVKSIAWIQDWRSVGIGEVGVTADSMGGSELNYFCVKPSAVGVDTSGLGHWDYLLQATDTSIFFVESHKVVSDFSLMGYIPPKRVLDSITQEVGVEIDGHPLRGAPLCKIGDLVEELRRNGLTWNTYDSAEAVRVINRYLTSRFDAWPRTIRQRLASAIRGDAATLRNWPADQRLLSNGTMYTIENEVMRAQARKQIVDNALQVSQSLRLFGVGEWQTYPEYVGYYQGPLRREGDVRRMYASTRLNLHNAMTQLHARVLDCMASGGIIMVNRMRHNTFHSPDCLRAHFEEGVHYFEYDEEDFVEKSRSLLQDEGLRQKVAKAAVPLIEARHTWSQRVEQILKDYEKV